MKKLTKVLRMKSQKNDLTPKNWRTFKETVIDNTRGNFMGKGAKYSTEKIITMLRQAEILEGQGKSLDEILRTLGIVRSTLYRWRKEFGNLSINQAKKLKELEVENSKLKRLVADQALDILVLKDFNQGKH